MTRKKTHRGDIVGDKDSLHQVCEPQTPLHKQSQNHVDRSLSLL